MKYLLVQAGGIDLLLDAALVRVVVQGAAPDHAAVVDLAQAVDPASRSNGAVHIVQTSGPVLAVDAAHGIVALDDQDFAPAAWLPTGTWVDAVTKRAHRDGHAWRMAASYLAPPGR